MSESGGFEPQVGEIRAVRTFRIGAGGLLYPLFDNHAWLPGGNAARCRITDDPNHRAPNPDCTCGFYAYSSVGSAREYPHARYVLAVIACWGRIITGTRGLRAEFARIEGIWFAPDVPSDLAQLVAARYPDVRRYERQPDLLAAHPLSDPEPVVGPTRTQRVVRILGATVAVVAGAVPLSWIGRIPYGWWIWGALFAALLATALVPRRRSDMFERRRRLLSAALALWMAAPVAGWAGVLFLRLPLIQLAAVTTAQRWALNRAARTFPAEI